MARVIYSAGAYRDLARIADFASEHDATWARLVLERIQSAVSTLEAHPLIGRSAEHRFRELVISHGKTGYIALYRYLENEEVVLILALRHQPEAGYRAK